MKFKSLSVAAAIFLGVFIAPSASALRPRSQCRLDKRQTPPKPF